MKRLWAKRSGFTIVELLIVIVVIGILAAVTIVAYNGIQARANDTKMRSAAHQLEKAMISWSSSNGNVIRGGNGSTEPAGDNGCTSGLNGFFKGTYACSAEDSLVKGNALPLGFSASLPSNPYIYQSVTDGRFAMMLWNCGSAPGKYILLWTLRNPTVNDATTLDDAAPGCGYSATSFRDSYGMRAAKVIQLL